MTGDVLLYFDVSGNAGPVGSVAKWTAFGAWAETLPPTDYQEVLHLWEQGWEQDLEALAAQLERGLAEQPPADADARAAATELLDQLQSRAEADTAVAVGE